MDRALQTLLVAALFVGVAVSVPVLSAGAGETPESARTDGPLGGVIEPSSEANATVTRLGVGGATVTEGFHSVAPNVGTAVAIGDREFRGQLLGYETLHQFRKADTAAANKTAVRTGIDEFQERVELLRDVEATAIGSYHTGAIGERELLQRIARTDAEAGGATAALKHLRQRARAIDPNVVTFELRARSFSVARDFDGFETPIRESLNRTIRGGSTMGRVHAVASEEGLVLETIHDGTYVRDAVRTDHYDPTEPPTIGRSEAISMVFDRYPSLSTNSSVSGPNQIAGRLWQVQVRYAEGESTVFLDRSTEQIYREVHELALDELETTTVATETEGGLEVVVNRTPEGNPYQIRAVDSLTGEPVDATVTVGNETVGDTGGDGRLWTLGARGQFSIRVETDGGSVTVGIDP
jgi:hypothetical protein